MEDTQVDAVYLQYKNKIPVEDVNTCLNLMNKALSDCMYFYLAHYDSGIVVGKMFNLKEDSNILALVPGGNNGKMEKTQKLINVYNECACEYHNFADIAAKIVEYNKTE